MALTREQMERAQAAETRQWRVAHLAKLNARELTELLSGNPAAALPWVVSAAEYGITAAQLRLGRMLLEGTGVNRDPSAAVEWFRRAASSGDAEAMNMLGRCHENGWGAEVDFAAAARHYRDSANRGHDWGEYNFGNMLFDGRGVPCDRAQALMWYLKAAHQGHSRAMNLVGRSFEEGWGSDPNPAVAALWYQRSAEAGYFRGQYNYAAVLAQQGQSQDAAGWYLRAAMAGDGAMRRAILRALSNARDPVLIAVRRRVGALCDARGESRPHERAVGSPQT
jgi:uncharacterized protein